MCTQPWGLNRKYRGGRHYRESTGCRESAVHSSPPLGVPKTLCSIERGLPSHNVRQFTTYKTLSYLLSHLIFTATLGGKWNRNYYKTHFMHEHTEAQISWDLFKVTNTNKRHGWVPNLSPLTCSPLDIHHLCVDCQVLCQKCRLTCNDLKNLMQQFYQDL